MGATYRSISMDSSYEESYTVPRPPGAQAEDTLWAVQAAYFAPFEDLPGPSGGSWTPAGVLDGGESFLYSRVYKLTLTSPGPSAYTFHQDPTIGFAIIVCVPGASTTIASRVAAAQAFAAGSIVTPNVTPAASSHLELRVALGRAVGVIDEDQLGVPLGYVLRGQIQTPGILYGAVATREITSSSPSGAKTFTVTPATLAVSHGISISIPSGAIVPEVPPIPVDAPGAGDALYSYRFSRLFGGRLGDLDLHGVSFESRISRRGQINVGNFSATYPISNEDQGDLVAAIVPRYPADLLRGPGVTVVDIYRGGELWGDRYWIIGAKITKQRRSRPVLTLSGVTMEAYLQYVALEEQLGPFTDEDRVEIARQIIAHMQSQEHANIGLILAPGSAGSTLTRTYEAYKGMYGGPLADTTAGVDGYEFMINSVLGASGVELHWVHGQPLGDADGPGKHVWNDSPGGGEILDYSIDMTPLARGTRWRARGDSIDTDASTTSEPLLSAAYSSPHLATGVWPRLDRTVDRPGVTDLGQLNAIAEELAEKSGGAPHVMSITVLLGEQPTIRPSLLGDSGRVIISDEWFKRVSGGAGLDERRRVLGMRVTPTGREDGRDEAELFIDDQEVE